MAFRAGGLAILIALAAAPAAAEGWLALPVDCRIGETCWPLQYVDHDPGPEARDYRCGGRAYDGHSGTDIGLGTEAEIARDVPVLAAAPGRVAAGELRRTGRDALDRRGRVGARLFGARSCRRRPRRRPAGLCGGESR
ncbi:MAG: hypothetical protein RIM80_14780, partial [Alphaproteobacteria bacterium]